MPEGLSFEQIDVFFRVKSYEGVITNNEPDRCDELAFFPLNDLPTATAPFIRQALECIQEGKSYSEFGFG
jgi:8-oxo-dGTP diphosphatase